jgi:hypothetical protein
MMLSFSLSWISWTRCSHGRRQQSSRAMALNGLRMMPLFPSPCISPSRRPRPETCTPVLSLAGSLLSAPSFGLSTFPSGPRSGPGSSVPVHLHLSGHIRPTHPVQSDFASGLYGLPSLCALSTPRHRVSGSELSWLIFVDMSPSVTPGNPMAAYAQFLRHRRWLSSIAHGFSVSESPCTPIPAGVMHFGASLPFACATTCRLVRLPRRS